MAWTAPMTAVASTVFTAAQWNIHGRDNLNMNAPGVATTAGGWIVTAGYNTLAQRIPAVQYTGTSGNTDSTSYTDLDSFGSTVTITTGPMAIVSIGSQISNSTAGVGGRVSVATTGASSIPENDGNSFYIESGNANDAFKGCWTTIFSDNFVAGSNTFTQKYRASGGGVATFSGRLLTVIPF